MKTKLHKKQQRNKLFIQNRIIIIAVIRTIYEKSDVFYILMTKNRAKFRQDAPKIFQNFSDDIQIKTYMMIW